MGLFKKGLLAALAALYLLCCIQAHAQPYHPEIYKAVPDGFPCIRAILSGKHNPRTLIYYKNQSFHMGKRMRIDDEWFIEEIRRESVLFKRSSTHNFAEIYLNAPKKAKRHTDRSFFGHPISLWEAVELLAYGFGYQAVMHYQSSASIVPGCHGNSIIKLLGKIVPSELAFYLQGPMLYILPKKVLKESSKTILQRLVCYDANKLITRFSGLNRQGVLNSRGNDIQYVLRQISLGSGVNISFSKNLHFQVYASFRNIPFAQMLAKIAIINQCMILERENFIEICPWPGVNIYGHINDGLQPEIQSSPFMPFLGFGATPPPKEPSLAQKKAAPPPREPVLAPKEPILSPKEPVLAPRKPILAPKKPIKSKAEPF